MSANKPRTAGSVDWDDFKDEFGFSAEEGREVEQRTSAMLSEVRGHRLAELRKRRR